MKYTIKAYDNIIKQLIEEFIKVYYTYDDWSVEEYYIIWEWGRLSPNTAEIADMFWNIDNMYEALKNDIPKEKLFDWYDRSLDLRMENSNQDSKKKDITVVNLMSYSLWAIPYTKEDRAEAEKNIKHTRATLGELIKKELSK